MAVEKLCYWIYFLGLNLFSVQNLCFIHILCSWSNSCPICLFSVVFFFYQKHIMWLFMFHHYIFGRINPQNTEYFHIDALHLHSCNRALKLCSFLKLISCGELGLCFSRWVLLLLGTHLELPPIPMEKLVLCLMKWTAQTPSFPLVILELVGQPLILDTKHLLSKLECWCFKKILGKFNFVVHNLAVFFPKISISSSWCTGRKVGKLCQACRLQFCCVCLNGIWLAKKQKKNSHFLIDWKSEQRWILKWQQRWWRRDSV